MDIIIFIKNIQLPFDDVIKDFDRVLSNISLLGHEMKIKRCTPHSLKVTVDNYEFDVLPAIDFVPEANIEAERGLMLQQQRTLDKMKEVSHRQSSDYSSSLAFSTVEFMKQQSSLAHDMARLAKFWYKSACITENVYGAKYAMELIAVHVSNSVTARYGNNNFHLVAFQKFLEAVESFNDVDIIFEDAYRLVKGHEPCKNREAPSILDPANPYNNLAIELKNKPNALKALKMHATRTLNNIRGMQSNLTDFDVWRIIEIFIPDIFFHRTCKVLVGTSECFVWATGQPAAITIRVDVDDVVRKKIEFMHLCLTTLYKATTGAFSRVPDRYRKIYAYIMEQQTAQPDVRSERHEDRDVTLCLKIKSSIKCLLVGYSFNIPAS